MVGLSCLKAFQFLTSFLMKGSWKILTIISLGPHANIMIKFFFFLQA